MSAWRYFRIQQRRRQLKQLFDLFFTFAKIGAVTFGGGYAMLPILTRELVEKRGWTTEEELTDYFAVGQCTPGVIAVNTATFIGHKKNGILGGIFATLGVVFPSLVIISIIAAVLNKFAQYEIVKNAFAGIRVAVCALILSSVIKLFKKAVVDVFGVIIFLCVLASSVFFGVSPVIFVIVSAILGIIIKVLGGKAK